MNRYVVMFPADDEEVWAAGSEADHQVTYDTDEEFVSALVARGGAVTGGAALAPSRRARTIRSRRDAGPLVTDGPFAETTEQLSGFYLVTCDRYEDLVAAAEVLVRAHPVVEIRPVDES